MDYAIVLLVGTLAGTLGGIIGTGSSLMLMPVLVLLYGPQQAVPVMAIGAVMGNLGRVLAWRREIVWRACAAYCLTAVPAAALGVRTLLILPPRAVEIALGLFFLAMIPARRWMARHQFAFSLLHLALIGAPIGFLTGIVVSTGPITVPVFLGHGLERGSFLGTEAAASVAVYAAKVGSFQAFGALPAAVVLQGLIAGAALMSGAFLARPLVLSLTPAAMRLLIDGLMLCSGTALLWAAFR